MKNEIFLIVLISLIAFSGCKARKNTVRTSQVETATHTETRKTDTARTTTTFTTNMEAKDSLRQTTERETIHLDDSGRIRRIVRESVRTETGSGWTYRGQRSVLSVTGKTDSTAVVETMRASSHETTETKTDSRAIQGFEWFWVIIAASIVVAAIIFLVIRKSKIVNRKL